MSESYTVTQLARRFGVSRSTLLYYESRGLLEAASRSRAGYRRYGEREAERLSLICTYRRAGLPLDVIARLVSGDAGKLAAALERRLTEINQEIAGLRDQQALLVRLLSDESALRKTRVMSKDRWVALLREAGLDDAAMARWHAAFEAKAPEAHQDFLESLGIPDAEIRTIRRWSRRAVDRRAAEREA